ncbi:hypothetical protein [Ochrobactrum sp. RH2CCR150]|uniref:hypothetical protein n=1 Tax=Ochrobactrum sp. RH2CCR150 TaxID=2587044 RepID=UPI0015FB3E92|nr:hypothetical protein [Ochrobactrum sp. RH2CCR150]
MARLVRIYNTTYRKYLAYLPEPTDNGTYTVLLLEDDANINADYIWHLNRMAENVFTLEVPHLDAQLIQLGDNNPNIPNGSSCAWLVKRRSQSPMELIYDRDAETITTNTGSVSEYLSGIPNDPYAYFVGRSVDQWEIQDA